MDCFNTTTLGLLVGFVITSTGFGQTSGTLLKQFETPASLVVVYQDDSPTLAEAENKLAMLRNEHPDKLLLRIALYQSQADEKTTEEQSVAGHTSMESWKVESEKQKALASPMAEAIFINGFGLSRAYLRRTVTEGVPSGLLPLRDIELGASKLSLLYVVSGQTGPNSRGFIHLYFRSTGTVTQLDADSLANKIGLTELSPAELSISGDSLFVEDTRYPRFNRFVEPAYHLVQGANPLDNHWPEFSCMSITKKPVAECVTIKPLP